MTNCISWTWHMKEKEPWNKFCCWVTSTSWCWRGLREYLYREEEKPRGKKFKEWNQTNVDSESLCQWEGDRCTATGRKKKTKGGLGWGSEELVLLLLWPPSLLIAALLEVFQRALLYLIKASQAPGKAPRPAIFLHFLQMQAGILKERVAV